MITESTKAQKETVVKIREISFDGLMSEADQDIVTGVSRVTRWRMEREGKFPKRVQISPGRQARHGPEIREWIDSRPYVVECIRNNRAQTTGTGAIESEIKTGR